MKRFLGAATVFMLGVSLASSAVAQDYNYEEVMQRLQQLEQRVAQLEAENEALRAGKAVRVMPRKKTKKLEVRVGFFLGIRLLKRMEFLRPYMETQVTAW